MARKRLRKIVSEDLCGVSFSILFSDEGNSTIFFFFSFWILCRVQKKLGILICTACSLWLVLLPSARYAELGNTFIITLAEAGNRK